MDLESNECADSVKKASADVSSTHVDRTQNVSNNHQKRPPEEPEGVEDRKRKILKIDDNCTGHVDSLEMSKRQLKKLRKKQKWLDDKPKRALINKLKKKERQKMKAQLKESGVQINKVVPIKMAASSCKQRIVLDMSYDHLMSDKDLNQCSNQLLRCYSVNRRMKNPMQFYVSSYKGKFKEVLSKHNGAENWDIKYEASSFDELFKKEEIVYLTSDSSNVLDTLDESKVYIIGGLVDHNSFKGASLKLAENLGVAHAQLPISEYINMKTRKVLPLFHVYEILSKVVSGMSWKEAFMNTIPKRKMFSAKDEEISLDNSDCSDNNIEKNDGCTDSEKKQDVKCSNVYVKDKNEYLVVKKNVKTTE